MDKEQLIKLAVVAGLKNAEIMTDEISGEKFVSFLDEFDCWTFWRPHKDIAQSMEVLEGGDYGYQIHYTKRDKLYRVRIKRKNVYWGHSKTLPEAICKAVLKATEQG